MSSEVDIPPRTMRTRWAEWRNGWLGSAAFQRMAARMPFMRPVARARSRAMFDLVAGFAYSQVLYAMVTGGILARLGAGPAPLAALAEAAGLQAEAAARLLRAAASLDLVEEAAPGWWVLGGAGAIIAGAPGVCAMIAHHRHLYADLADPLELLRGRREGAEIDGFWGYGANDAANAAAYSALMAASQPMVADQFLRAYDLRQHHKLLDIGGGEGAFARRVAAVAPHLRLVLFDLEPVAARARAALAAAGLEDRVEVHGGSFLLDPLPRGADLVTLVRVLHDHDDADAGTLLRRIREVLPPGGVLVITEPMAGERKPTRVGDAYFGLYFAAMGRGRARKPSEIRAMLLRAGFRSAREAPTELPMIAQIIVAKA